MITQIDRIAPTQRPASPPAGWQQWRALAFLHWEVPIQALRPLVPAPLELDLFAGTAYVGLVPFAMRNIRNAGCLKPLALNFLETNVRTYVCCDGKPGVYFLSLDADSRIAVTAARALWSLPYHCASMQLERSGDLVQYRLRRRRGGADLSLRCEIGEPCPASQPGTLQHFLLERYFLFVRRQGCIRFAQVRHVPYPAQTVHVQQCRESLFAAAGLPSAAGLPPVAHFVEGVDVEVFPLTPVRGRNTSG